MSTSAPIALDDEELQKIYIWVDEIPLSRPKRHISRDFSDGVLLAEIIKHYYPKLVEMHNYSPANSVRQKMYNWATLNQKVFRRLQFPVERAEIDAIVGCKPGAIELLLFRLQRHIAEIRAGRKQISSSRVGSGTLDGGSSIHGDTWGSQSGGNTAPPGGGSLSGTGVQVSPSVLEEKDATITELQETIDILELKVRKLEQLVRLKDSRIAALTQRLTNLGS